MKQNEVLFKALPQETQTFLHVLSVLTAGEGADVKAVFKLMGNDDAYGFYEKLDELARQLWIYYDLDQVFVNKYVCDVLDSPPLTELRPVLLRLIEVLEVSWLDDLVAKGPYFLIARHLFESILRSENGEDLDGSLLELLSDAIILFARQSELSYPDNTRKAVNELEERLDYRLLTYLENKGERLSIGQRTAVQALKGKLFAEIFRYEEAENCFSFCRENKMDAFLERAIHYENRGLYCKALKALKDFFYYDIAPGNNVYAALRIALICAESGAAKSARIWLDKGYSIASCSIPREHPLRIFNLAIEGLLSNDLVEALGYLAQAEALATKVYGAMNSTLAKINYYRSLIYAKYGQYRKSSQMYAAYCRINHYNNGFSIADTAVHLTDLINYNVRLSNHTTSHFLQMRLWNMFAEGAGFAPTVRIAQAVANAEACLNDEKHSNRVLSKTYYEIGQAIVSEYKPTTEELSLICDLFEGESGMIPADVTWNHLERILQDLYVDIHVSCGDLIKATAFTYRLLGHCNNEDRNHWKCVVAYVLALRGFHERARNMWNEVIENASIEYKFSVAKECANYAVLCGMNDDAKEYYDIALSEDVRVFASELDLAVTLNDNALCMSQLGWSLSSLQETYDETERILLSIDDNELLPIIFYGRARFETDLETKQQFLQKCEEYYGDPKAPFDEFVCKLKLEQAECAHQLGRNVDTKLLERQIQKLYPAEELPDEILYRIGRLSIRKTTENYEI